MNIDSIIPFSFIKIGDDGNFRIEAYTPESPSESIIDLSFSEDEYFGDLSEYEDDDIIDLTIDSDDQETDDIIDLTTTE